MAENDPVKTIIHINNFKYLFLDNNLQTICKNDVDLTTKVIAKKAVFTV